MSAQPFAPTACTFDVLGLTTHGEFRCYQSVNPCLNLFTHGEFPRAGTVAVVEPPPPHVVGSTPSDDVWPQYAQPEITPEEIAFMLLMLDEC